VTNGRGGAKKNWPPNQLSTKKLLKHGHAKFVVISFVTSRDDFQT
jgi:hypothetical protein